METQRFMGRNQLVKRLAAQVGSKSFAISLLKKRGHLDAGGKRDVMTAEERAIDRASQESGKPASQYTYDPTTNRATLK